MKKVIKSVLAMAIAAFAFTSCEDVPEPYSLPTEGGNETVVVEPTGSGTAADPYNVVAVLDYVNSLGADVESEQNVYIKGKVVSITEEFSTQYGNATYYISDDGTKNNQFYVYRSLYLDNKKFAEGNTQIQEGDEVVVCGKVVNYKGATPETVQNKSFLYSLNGVGGNGGETPQPAGEATGSGTEADPYNAVAANNLANSLADNAKSDNVYIKGKVVSIKEQFGTQYGNATFYISDDGTEAGQFYVYRALYLGNKKYTAGDLLKEGDEVVIYGKVTKYVNQYGTTLETVQNEAYVYSLNGKTEGGGGETPQPQGDFGTAEAPITVAQALTFIEGLGDGKTTDAEAYVKGKIKSVTEVSTSYGNATYVISDEGADNELTVFRGYYLGGEKFTAEDQIKVGDEVIVKGKLQKYVNKEGAVTPEIATGSTLYSLNGETGGDTPTPQPGGDVAETGDNGNFETWVDGLPVNWKPASTAGNATLAQSTDAHGGSYSVKVAGSTSGNKRIGYKELQLNQGTYAITFYAKGLSEGGTVNPGVVPITNGAVGNYKYAGYVDNVSTSEWQKVEASVDITSAGTYCFVIMNQKKSEAVDILIDDFTVTMGGKEVIK